MSHTVLVPLELPDAQSVPQPLVDALAEMDVVVLGHFGLPEQTPPSVGRDQFETEAQMELDELARGFEQAGASVTTRLVFGKDRTKTIDRISGEESCDVILTPGEMEGFERLLVPLRGEENFDRILSFVAELLETSGGSVTLYHSTSEDDRIPGEQLLADATDWLIEAGVDGNRIETELSEEGDPRANIVEFGAAFDVLVLGETKPSLRERILGNLPAGVTATTDAPAFVIRDVGRSGTGPADGAAEAEQ
jgi:nucleotide-binding universal stress UspA family protein